MKHLDVYIYLKCEKFIKKESRSTPSDSVQTFSHIIIIMYNILYIILKFIMHTLNHIPSHSNTDNPDNKNNLNPGEFLLIANCD